MLPIDNSFPVSCLTRSTASLMTVSVRNPRKSIFKSPSSSIVVIVNCVVMEPSDPLESGTNSSAGFWQITTPAACMEVCLGKPSSFIHMSNRFFTCSSVSYLLRSSGFISNAFCSVIFSSFGIILASVSPKLYGRSSTRATSRITPFAAIVPKVTICTTLSAPYLRRT